MNLTIDEAKSAARALRRGLSTAGTTITHSQALELVAQQLQFVDWNTAAASLSSAVRGSGAAIPVLRVQDHQRARDFYLVYLGFALE